MGAHIEWVIGNVRAGKEMDEYGDPYSFVCTVIRTGDEAEIVAGCGEFTKETYKEIKKQLNDMGIRKISWERIRPTGKRRAIDEMKT